ncbi:unnamed protein product [Euphydryas editha]|uniref:Uncharacterized protein n=1 Tax=Euphydryas editha TaxID=104508 RepID=A0AAU9VDW8_EUPED|nr:unnamed protein product [Euphydryas editha]
MKIEVLEVLDRHNVASFPAPTKTRLSCNITQYNTIKGSYFIVSPKECIVQTPVLIIITITSTIGWSLLNLSSISDNQTLANKDDHLKGQVLKIMNIPFGNGNIKNPETRKLTLKSADLHSLYAAALAAKEISTETLLTLNNADVHSVYFTITLLYLVLLVASALGIIFVLRKYLSQRPFTVEGARDGTRQRLCRDCY